MLARRAGRRQAAALDFPRGISPWYISFMKTQDVLATLRRHESELRARGVAHVAVFGSVARGEHKPGSDLDLMIDVAPDAPLTVYGYVGLKEYIAGLFEGQVDVVTRDALKPYVRPAATADAIYAF
jgi:predicted nucleotidyltransferase